MSKPKLTKSCRADEEEEEEEEEEESISNRRDVTYNQPQTFDINFVHFSIPLYVKFFRRSRGYAQRCYIQHEGRHDVPDTHRRSHPCLSFTYRTLHRPCKVSVLQKVAGSGPAVNTLLFVDRAPGTGLRYSEFIYNVLALNNPTCSLRPAYRLPLDKKISLFLDPYGSYFEAEKCSILPETTEIKTLYTGSAKKKCLHTLTKENSTLYNRLL